MKMVELLMDTWIDEVEELLKENKATVEVLNTPDKWYGVTYREDKPMVMEAVRRMKAAGAYPEKLWND